MGSNRLEIALLVTILSACGEDPAATDGAGVMAGAPPGAGPTAMGTLGEPAAVQPSAPSEPAGPPVSTPPVTPPDTPAVIPEPVPSVPPAVPVPVDMTPAPGSTPALPGGAGAAPAVDVDPGAGATSPNGAGASGAGASPGGAGAAPSDPGSGGGGPLPEVEGLEPSPSPGCGGGGEGTPQNALVSTPDGYDGSTPAPLVIAFHAAGNGNDQLQGIFGGEGTDRGYLMVFPKSAGNGWSPGADNGRVDDSYDHMLNNYCVDTNRVFSIGHSSGAQMITQLLCAGEDRFRAVAPVASSRYCDGWDAVPAVVIHGLDDIERGGQGQDPYNINDADGTKDFAVYSESNGCGSSSTAFDPSGGNCGGSIAPGCVEYEGCDEPTQFCNHNDPQYGTSNHGVPCFGPAVVFDFFDRFN